MKRTPIRKVSAKRIKARGPRKKAVRLAAERQGWKCAGIDLVPGHECYGPLVGHEPLKRSRGGDHTDEGDIVVVCWGLNDWVEDNDEEATELGLSISQGALYRDGRYLKKYEREALTTD